MNLRSNKFQASASFLICLMVFLFSLTAYAEDITISSDETWSAGNYSYDNITINNNALLTLQSDPITGTGVTLNVTNLSIEVGSTISASGQGYPGGEGPGAGDSYDDDGLGVTKAGGAGYGGNGGDAYGYGSPRSGGGGSAYGSLTDPSDLGSGGGDTAFYSTPGNGGSGGGMIRINCLGTLTVDGQILSNGNGGITYGSGGTGGGSGGSIHITTDILAGTGSISANGGSGGVYNSTLMGGGGSGGRIAIYYTDDTGFTGSITAYGGSGYQYGAAGTFFTKSSIQDHGDLVVDNNDQYGAVTLLPDGTYDLDTVTVTGYAILDLSENTVLNTTDLLTENGGTFSHDTGTLNVTNTSIGGVIYIHSDLTIADDIVIPTGGILYLNASLTVPNLIIEDGGTLTHSAQDGDFSLTVTNDLTVMPGGRIDASGQGYPGSTGPGAGSDGYGSLALKVPGGGGGYGGVGGRGRDIPGGTAYGSITQPFDLGSGGGSSIGDRPGGRGGGLIRIECSGTATIDGAILANGVNGYLQSIFNAGGGSGGSIYITTGTFAGSGIISAGGGYGDPDWSGGGAGGRIAIYYTDDTGFAGDITAYGGSGYEAGAAGTVFTKSSNQTYGDLVVDNNDQYGAVTLLPDGTYDLDTVTVTGYAILDLSENTVLNTTDLLTENGGTFSHDTGTLNVTNTSIGGVIYIHSDLTIADDIVIPTGGILYLNASLTVPNLIIEDGGTLTHSAQDGDFSLTVTNDLTVMPGGRIDASGQGYPGGEGPGAGDSYDLNNDGNLKSGGGGYGGSGGDASGYSSGHARTGAGGSAYGSLIIPADLGSGGGNAAFFTTPLKGGSGGGIIRINCLGTMTVDGEILSNGNNGVNSSNSAGTGGGSGGSIHITTDILAGVGSISANGGGGGAYSSILMGGGGSGGRISVYYRTSTFSGSTFASGGAGYNNGEDGTIIIGGELEAPATIFTLHQKHLEERTLTEVLVSQNISMNNITATGDLSGTLIFSDFKLVKINTGPFSGKGFYEGGWSATLDGLSYSGYWRGVCFFNSTENTISLKGATSGDITGTIEGQLEEFSQGSSEYDKLTASWKLTSIKGELVSGTIELNGNYNFLSSVEYPSVEVKTQQLYAEGFAYGYYTGPLSALITIVNIDDPNSNYNNQGFAIMSYVSNWANGEAWSYSSDSSSQQTQIFGLSGGPLSGLLSCLGSISESTWVVNGTIEHFDVHALPMPDLKVETWGPSRVSPGQTVNYICRYGNEGTIGASNVTLINELSLLADYISNTGEGTYDRVGHDVIWNVDNIPAGSSGYFTVTARIQNGLQAADRVVNIITLPKEVEIDDIDPTVSISYEPVVESQQYVKTNMIVSNSQESGIIETEISFEDVTQVIDPVFNIIKTTEDVTMESVFPMEGAKKVWAVAKTSKEIYDIAKKARQITDQTREHKKRKRFLDWLRDEGYITQEQYDDSNNGYETLTFGRLFIPEIGSKVGYGDALKITLGKPMDVFWEATLNRYIYYGSYSELTLKEAYKMYLQEMSDGFSTHASTIAVAHDPNIKYGPEGNVSPGQKLDYRVEYENEGEGIAFGVYFTDTLDEDLDESTLEIGQVRSTGDDTVIAEAGIYHPSTRTITWFAGEVGPGEGGYADFSVNVRSDAEPGTEIINYGTVYFPSVPEETRTNGIVSIVVTDEVPNLSINTEKAKVCWHHDDLHVEGRLFLPDGVWMENLSPVGSSVITLANIEVTDQNVGFVITGKNNDKWEYKDKDNLNGNIKEFKIDWKGAKFDYHGDNKFHIHTHFIGGIDTTLCIHTGDVSGSFSVAINGTSIAYDEARNITTDVAFEPQKDDSSHIHFTLPFQFTSDMTINVTGALELSINVADYYTENYAKFKLVSAFNPDQFPDGTLTLSDTLGYVISLGDGIDVITGEDVIGIGDKVWTKKDNDHWEYK
jgi:uncharacterized protein DUF11